MIHSRRSHCLPSGERRESPFVTVLSHAQHDPAPSWQRHRHRDSRHAICRVWRGNARPFGRSINRSTGCRIRPPDPRRTHRRRHRQPVVSRGRGDPRRHHRARRARDRRAGAADHRRQRPRRRARIHRHPHARAARHLRGADGGELRAAGRDDADRGTGRQFAASAEAVSRQAGGAEDERQHRIVRRAGDDPRRGDRRRRSRGDAGRHRAHDAARRAGHARRRVRLELRPVLRAGLVRDHGGSDGAGARRGTVRRHLHLAHARGSVEGARQREGDDRDRRAGRPADAGDASQGDRRHQLGPQRRDAARDRRGAGARRGCDDRSVSVHRVEHERAGGAAAALGAGRRTRARARAAARCRDAREDSRRGRGDHPHGTRRRRSEERAARELRLRSHARGQDAGRRDAHARRRRDDAFDIGIGIDIDRGASNISGGEAGECGDARTGGRSGVVAGRAGRVSGRVSRDW